MVIITKIKASILLEGRLNNNIPYRFITLKTAYKHNVKGYIEIKDNKIQIEAEAERNNMINFHNDIAIRFRDLKCILKVINHDKIIGFTEFNFNIQYD